jgi:ribosomal-protein-alanine N-acetyltransferase
MKSARIGFRCWSRDDLPLARELWSDIEVTRFLGGPFSDEEIGERLEREIARMSAYQFQYWPIYLLSSGEHIGCCGLRPYKAAEQIPELGFHLRPRCWGQGLASEAARTVIRYAFENLGAKGLSAGHHPNNTTSKKLLAKLGFRYTHDEFYAPLEMNLPYYLLLPSA